MKWKNDTYAYGYSDVDPFDKDKTERYGVEYLLSPNGTVVARIDKCYAPEDICFYRDLAPVINELNKLHSILCAIQSKHESELKALDEWHNEQMKLENQSKETA